MTDAASLAENKLLGDLPADERERLAQAARWARFEPGDKIIARDGYDTDMICVASGEVEIANYALSGRQIAFARLGPGDAFGELSAIDGETRSADAVAATPCQVARIDGDALRRVIERHPAVAWRLLQRLAGIIRATNERVMDLATLSAQQRVISELLRAAGPDAAVSGQWAVDPLPRQDELARRASTTRETVARVLSQLKTSELVAKKGRRLTLRDKATLERMAQRLAAAGAGLGQADS